MKVYCILLFSLGFNCSVFGANISLQGTPRTSAVELKTSETPPSEVAASESIKKMSQIRVPGNNKIQQKFKPSEEISEDLAIPFPVDI